MAAQMGESSVAMFQLTNTAGRTTTAVSTHASVRRRPARFCGFEFGRKVSTHASVRRRPCAAGPGSPTRRFNSRLREEATSTPLPDRARRSFQLTPP